MNKSRHSSHSTYLCRYHLIFCPKFRFRVLKDGVDETLKEILQKICDRYRYEIQAMEVMPDHIHFFLSAPQTAAPADIARTIKSISAIELFKAYPDLKHFYQRCGRLWSNGYFIATAADASAETIKKYIEDQKSH